MPVTQAYFLAHTARVKLSFELARPDHNLRLVVGHANLLDSLMLDLVKAEQEQEPWFDRCTRDIAPSNRSGKRYTQRLDSVFEEPERDGRTEDAEGISSLCAITSSFSLTPESDRDSFPA
ncbi:hypothetical protein B0T25DRAFT_533505 [Lasiosphaeria hispida]|uniref:Uncharacterized protein n=1 Tax=Lasiosphaeria hispida TaxID=260671 RepID=A0AAJ0HR17_9PEZI|nr:hypothetical protein B0T25DRAFT_533505 [Lasiosphaeria hispida]